MNQSALVNRVAPCHGSAADRNEVLKRRTKLWVYLAVGPLVGFMLLRWFEQSQIYRPSREADCHPADFQLPVEDVTLTARDGVRLHGWWIPAPVNSPRRQLAVLFCHGNGGNLTSRPGYYQAIRETGVNLFTFDYRGYGRSAGSPGEAGTYLDAHAAYAWLRARGFAGGDIILWGESLGGGIASELALHEPVGGLVLQSSFTSIPDLGGEVFPWLPVRLIATIQYDTVRRLPRIHVPVLILHSRQDELIGFHHAEKNFAAANEPKLLWELRGGHNEALGADRPRFVAGFEEFLRQSEERRGARSD